MLPSTMNPPPPLTALSDLDAQLRSAGYAVLDAASLTRMSIVALQQLNHWLRFWDDLPPDAHLRDGGRYRRRRHGSFIVDGEQISAVPPRAHWQPVAYNALHGGIERHFEPIEAGLVADPAWNRLLTMLGERASALRGPQRWYVEAHTFRIDTEGGIGRPTPEGAHRDGVDLVAVFLVGRWHVKGGETRVFEADGPRGERFTLTAPWSLLLLDDARVIHESTPIQPLADRDGNHLAGGHRDTLVVTCRRDGFQGG